MSAINRFIAMTTHNPYKLYEPTAYEETLCSRFKAARSYTWLK